MSLFTYQYEYMITLLHTLVKLPINKHNEQH